MIAIDVVVNTEEKGIIIVHVKFSIFGIKIKEKKEIFLTATRGELRVLRINDWYNKRRAFRKVKK